MKCILHVGTEKTGTSTIQDFIYRNRETLKSAGVLVPTNIGRNGNHRSLSLASYSHKNKDKHRKAIGLYSPRKQKNFKNKITNLLQKEILEAKSKGMKTICISSEHIHSRLRPNEELDNLKSILHEAGIKETRVIIYIREQVACMNSMLNTEVLWAGRTSDVPKPRTDEIWTNICDHKESIKRLRKTFGTKNIKVRIFEKESFFKSDLIADFLQAAEVEIAGEYIKEQEPRNRSISKNGLEILLELNKELPLYLNNGSFSEARKRIPYIFQEVFKEGEKYGMSKEMEYAYKLEYRSSNEWVRKEYFPERVTLFSTGDNKARRLYQAKSDSKLIAKTIASFANGDSFSSKYLIELLLRRISRKIGAIKVSLVNRVLG